MKWNGLRNVFDENDTYIIGMFLFRHFVETYKKGSEKSYAKTLSVFVDT
jgi:hypothetical protein